MRAESPSRFDGRPFSRRQAIADGITDRELHGPRFAAVIDGVHEVPTVGDLTTVERVRRLVAATVVVHPDAVASCRSAAVLLGLPVRHPGDQVHVRLGTQIRRPQVIAHRGDHTHVVVDGFAVTTPTATFLDLSTELDDDWLLVTGDALVQNNLATAAEIHEAIDLAGGRRGVRRARKVAELVRVGSESPMESLVRFAIVSNGLPEPVVNGPAFDQCGRWLARVDLSYPDRRIAVEYQGDHHRSDVQQWRRDITRTRSLQEAGWTVIFVTAADLREPGRVISAIRVALARNAPRVQS